MRLATHFLPLLIALLPLAACAQDNERCDTGDGVTLQVLGSGGPIADDGRASTGYLVWVNGKARVLIDTGGGTFLRFGEAGAKFEDLDFVGLSHLHTDHSADFPALVKSGNFSTRTRALPVAGPVGDGVFPGLKRWLQAMFDRDEGAYAYLGSFLDGTSGTPMLTPREVPAGADIRVYTGAGLVVEALQVPHGIVPAVAFRVRVGDVSIVFSSDQNGSSPAFAEFAKDASILVMHMVIPEDAEGVASRLHAPPSRIGRIAAQAEPGKLVLSHLMARSLDDLDGNVGLVKSEFAGEVVLAEDLSCISP
ncbi:MAG: MBL fold metallo-hydrolase [Woeseiaceae bacterium]|jgi:ribonuclease BN (tRNA processing enzyme)